MVWFWKRTSKPSESTIPLVDDEKIAAERVKAEEGLKRVQKMQEEEIIRKQQIQKTVRSADELSALIAARVDKNGYMDPLMAAIERRGTK